MGDKKGGKEDSGRLMVVYSPPRFNWIKYWIQTPHMTAGSDGMWQNERKFGCDDDFSKLATYPRSAGTRGIILRLARENDVPLMFTLKQLSYWAAKHLGEIGLEIMQKCGRMKQ